MPSSLGGILSRQNERTSVSHTYEGLSLQITEMLSNFILLVLLLVGTKKYHNPLSLIADNSRQRSAPFIKSIPE